MITWAFPASSQSHFFTKELFKELREYVGITEMRNSKFFHEDTNLFIRNLLTDSLIIDDIGKDVVELVSDNYPYGIYSFELSSSPVFPQIFLRRNNEYEILNTSRAFSEILKDLIAYFEKYPDVPKKLLPLYTDAVFRVSMEKWHQKPFGIISINDYYLDILYGK